MYGHVPEAAKPGVILCAAQGAFVVTFGRAGEDKKFQKLGDVEATLQGFAGADYDLQVLVQHLTNFVTS